jgi:fructosamine-3-kinase
LKSATKYPLDAAMVRRLFKAAGLAGAEQITPLTGGEFNSAFAARAGGGEYVVKIAPDRNAPVLSYERNLMRQELACYDLIREKTTIKIPAIPYRDLSGAVIPPSWFIMEKLTIPLLSSLKLAGEAALRAGERKAELAAAYHRISGPGFGYPQMGLYGSWYEAIKNMTFSLVEDARRFGKNSPLGRELLDAIERHRGVLENVPCCLVNFDLWDNNLFCKDVPGGPELYLVDPERSFWGDPAADLVCLDVMHPALADKADIIAAYNRYADRPFETGPALAIRYNIMLSYLALVMYTERWSRYRPWNAGYWRNTLAARFMTKRSFAALTQPDRL